MWNNNKQEVEILCWSQKRILTINSMVLITSHRRSCCWMLLSTGKCGRHCCSWEQHHLPDHQRQHQWPSICHWCCHWQTVCHQTHCLHWDTADRPVSASFTIATHISHVSSSGSQLLAVSVNAFMLQVCDDCFGGGSREFTIAVQHSNSHSQDNCTWRMT